MSSMSEVLSFTCSTIADCLDVVPASILPDPGADVALNVEWTLRIRTVSIHITLPDGFTDIRFS